MPNMSYCRFRNTLNDLLDCQEHLEDELGEEEARARKRLIRACLEIAEEARSFGLIEHDPDEWDD